MGFSSQHPSHKKIDRQQNRVATTTPQLRSMQDNKKFKKQELSERLQTKLDKVYAATVCPACNEEFKKKTHVIRHLVESHQGEEPYKCIVSNCKRTKNYATREGLVYHLVSYHDDDD